MMIMSIVCDKIHLLYHYQEKRENAQKKAQNMLCKTEEPDKVQEPEEDVANYNLERKKAS